MSGRQLSERHRRTLEQGSGIAPDVIAERGYFTVERKADLQPLGFGRALQHVPTLVSPILSVVADAAPAYQHRPDATPVIRGKPRKYLYPQGFQLRLDVLPRLRAELGKPDFPLFVTEGPRKATR